MAMACGPYAAEGMEDVAGTEFVDEMAEIFAGNAEKVGHVGCEDGVQIRA